MKIVKKNLRIILYILFFNDGRLVVLVSRFGGLFRSFSVNF